MANRNQPMPEQRTSSIGQLTREQKDLLDMHNKYEESNKRNKRLEFEVDLLKAAVTQLWASRIRLGADGKPVGKENVKISKAHYDGVKDRFDSLGEHELYEELKEFAIGFSNMTADEVAKYNANAKRIGGRGDVNMPDATQPGLDSTPDYGSIF